MPHGEKDVTIVLTVRSPGAAFQQTALHIYCGHSIAPPLSHSIVDGEAPVGFPIRWEASVTV